MINNVILTGATGMVGEGVLLECLASPDVEKVLVVGRSSCSIVHEKLEEVLHNDFMNLSPVAEKFKGYDSCFFCAGVTSIGKKEDEYLRLTYDMTIHFAETFIKQNPNSKLTFCYVSGYGTDSTGQGKSMWARVKGRTENELLKMFPGSAYMFRPGYMKPVKGQKNIIKFYFGWQLIYPIMKFVMPKFTCTLQQVGKAMINCALGKVSKNILEVKDIIEASL
jgi:NAD dependent epimerase/dehydratase family